MKLKAAIERIPGGLMIVPLLLGMLLCNLDDDIRGFLRPGEKLLVPFFAFAEASTAGNATATPAAIAAAAAAAGSPHAAACRELVGPATAQISIAVIFTALLCPLAVTLVDRWQRARGIEARTEPEGG